MLQASTYHQVEVAQLTVDRELRALTALVGCPPEAIAQATLAKHALETAYDRLRRVDEALNAE